MAKCSVQCAHSMGVWRLAASKDAVAPTAAVSLVAPRKATSASQALSGFWHMCADLDIITRDSAEAIAAGHKVMDVFCLAQKTKRGGANQCFDVQSFMPARTSSWTRGPGRFQI